LTRNQFTLPIAGVFGNWGTTDGTEQSRAAQ
jgi:hypothetical protein